MSTSQSQNFVLRVETSEKLEIHYQPQPYLRSKTSIKTIFSWVCIRMIVVMAGVPTENSPKWAKLHNNDQINLLSNADEWSYRCTMPAPGSCFRYQVYSCVRGQGKPKSFKRFRHNAIQFLQQYFPILYSIISLRTEKRDIFYFQGSVKIIIMAGVSRRVVQSVSTT